MDEIRTTERASDEWVDLVAVGSRDFCTFTNVREGVPAPDGDEGELAEVRVCEEV